MNQNKNFKNEVYGNTQTNSVYCSNNKYKLCNPTQKQSSLDHENKNER